MVGSPVGIGPDVGRQDRIGRREPAFDRERVKVRRGMTRLVRLQPAEPLVAGERAVPIGVELKDLIEQVVRREVVELRFVDLAVAVGVSVREGRRRFLWSEMEPLDELVPRERRRLVGVEAEEV